MDLKKFLLFLVINFGALYIGSLITNDAVSADWYVNLNKAPWTPPGWVFGAMWSLIMVCLAYFMSFHDKSESIWRKVLILYVLQLLFNIIWNPVYFLMHWQLLGLIVLTVLLVLVCLIYINSRRIQPSYIKYFLLPYILWLCVAFSLNAYTYLNN